MPAIQDQGRTHTPKKKSGKKKPYTLPKTFRPEVTTDRRPAPKAGPVAPQRTGRRPQPPVPARAPVFPKKVPARPGAPTPRPVKRTTAAQRARAQQHGYLSQGKAVAKAQGGDQLRNAKAEARRYVREAQIARVKSSLIKGPPTPSVAFQHKSLENEVNKIPKQERTGLLFAQRLRNNNGVAPHKNDPRFRASVPELKEVLRVHKAPKAEQTKWLTEAKKAEERGLATEFAEEPTTAAAMKVIDQTQRGLYAGAGAAKAAIEGKDIGKAAKRGAHLKDRTTYSDVAKAAGIENKAVAGTLGFIGDVLLDPTTYVTLGTASVTAKVSAKAAQATYRKALKAGMTEDAAHTVARRAAQRAADKAAPGKGVTVKFAGKELPGVRKATAAAGRGGRKAAKKATPQRLHTVPGKARNVVRAVRPSITPDAVRAEQFAAGRGATRRARAHVSNVESRALTLSQKLERKLSSEDYAAVIDAIERNNLRKLPAHIGDDKELRGLVHDLRSALRGTYRQGRRAGVIKGDVRNPNWLRNAENQKLRRTVVGEQKRQTHHLTRLEAKEANARERAQTAEAVGVERAKGKAKLAAERAHGSARVAGERAAAREHATAAGEARRIERHGHKGDAVTEAAIGKRRATAARVKAERAYAAAQREAGIAVGHARSSSATLGEEAGRRAEQVTAPAGELHYAAGQRGVDVAHDKLNQTWRALEDARAAERAANKQLSDAAKGASQASKSRAGEVMAGARTRAREIRQAVARPEVERKTSPALEHAERQAAKVKDELADAHRTLAKHPARGEGRDAALAVVKKAERKLAEARSEVRAQEGVLLRGTRADKAATRYADRAAATEAARARHGAAQSIPTRRLAETDEQYLKRLRSYATTHDLRLLGDRVDKLLATKPSDRTKGYFPRDFDTRIAKQLGLSEEQVTKSQFSTRGPGRVVSRLTPGFKRAEQRRLVNVNAAREAEGQASFSTNVPLVALNHVKNVARGVATSKYATQLAKLGRPIKNADDLQAGESIYKLGFKDGKYGLHEVQGIPRKPTQGGQYVALDRQLVETLEDQVATKVATTKAGAGFDRVTGGWKRWAIASIGFHVRNAIGDLEAVYRNQAGHRMPGSFYAAGRAVRRASKQGTETRPTTTAKTIKVNGKDMSVDDFLESARREGVLDTGQIGGELKQFGKTGHKKVSKVSKGGGAVGRATKRWMTNRENLFRLATYKGQLDKGLSPTEAAERASRAHVDYTELSEFERVFLRRLFPFYTWTARQLPEVAKSMITHPGKLATIEKAREEVNKAFTGDTEEESRAKMSTAVQRQLPFVVKVGGKPVGLSWSSPSTLLNELPTSTNLGEYLTELGRFAAGQMNVLPKSIIEAQTGTNMVTRAQIENNDRPLTAAPSWVKHLPKDLQKKLDVTPGKNFTDLKTGKKVYGWRGRADWAYDQLMLGWVGQAATLLGAGRAPATEVKQAAIGFSGVRPDVLGKEQTEYAEKQRLRKDLDKLKRQRGILNQQGIGESYGHVTPEYERLSKRINELNKLVYPQKKKGSSRKKSGLGGPATGGGSGLGGPATGGGGGGLGGPATGG